MAVPKKRTSKSRQGMRRSHHTFKFTAAVTDCETCGRTKLMHHVCEHCGHYRGRKVMKGKAD